MDISLIDNPTNEECKPIEDGVLAYGLSVVDGVMPEKFAFHASDSGKLIGGATARVHLSQYYLDNLWVDEAFRQQGIATRIHAEVVDHARKLGCKRILLNTLNEKAVVLYRQLGYRELAVIENFIDGFDLHYMEKSLAYAD